MNVLSLFDGISCGQLALNKSGIKYTNYFSSEIDKHAITVTMNNFPDTIQLGDVSKVDVKSLPKIDLLIGGSPCQGFSFAGKQLNFNDKRSVLFFEYVRILKEIQQLNPNVKFLLENVKMKKNVISEIDQILGVNGMLLNSKLISAQNRPRFYWTNIIETVSLTDKNIYLKDILETEVIDKYFIKHGKLEWLKSFGEVEEKNGYLLFYPHEPEQSLDNTLILQWPHGYNKGGIRGRDGKTPTITTSSWVNNNLLLHKGFVRKLTPIECERLQTVPDNYTQMVSDTQRYKLLGNGWTVDVISNIFSHLN